ncbi:hypothetical protein [Staphylococcus epidermidis]|uniref:hypothetical protein n=1 Tax=Staphylococcus epidermidis TaxID=1282 RepID=UPI00287FB495|nr:hypothetical protein [Staphylococcus epidermidis]
MEKLKRGAKPKVDYWLTSEGLTLLQGWARKGLSNKQIAQNMGIHQATFINGKINIAKFTTL